MRFAVPESLRSPPDDPFKYKAAIIIVISLVLSGMLIGILWWPIIVPNPILQVHAYYPPVERNVCRIDLCGRTGPKYNPNTRIIKGRYAMEDEFPYQVSFWDISGVSSLIFCAGSMINDRWIVTVAHCLEKRILEHVRVSVNILRAIESEDNVISLRKYFIHPRRKVDQNFFDIALAKTSVSIAATSRNFVNPACLPYSDLGSIKSNWVFVSGFGHTLENGTGSFRLKTTQLEILPMSNCYRFKSFRADSMTCAGDFVNLSDTCQGDSGSGLTMKNKEGHYVIIGVTSFGHGCGRRDPSGVYTKISYYIDWICSTMFHNGLTD